MAICVIIENPDQDREKTDKVIEHLRTTGPVPPDGARLVFGGPAEPGWRMISVWDSAEAFKQFYAERLPAAYEQAGLSYERIKRTEFEVDRLTAGDLTGVPQPA